jgi:hypothetical protein
MKTGDDDSNAGSDEEDSGSDGETSAKQSTRRGSATPSSRSKRASAAATPLARTPGGLDRRMNRLEVSRMNVATDDMEEDEGMCKLTLSFCCFAKVTCEM